MQPISTELQSIFSPWITLLSASIMTEENNQQRKKLDTSKAKALIAKKTGIEEEKVAMAVLVTEELNNNTNDF